MNGVLVPPASPGWIKYPDSKYILCAAGSFIGPARSGLALHSDDFAPGPSQVADDQVAASGSVASDTLVISAHEVGLETGRTYWLVVGCRADAGLTNPRVAFVAGNGTVSDSTIWGTVVDSNNAYGLYMPPNAGAQLTVISSVSQTVKLRAYHTAGTGNVYIDVVYFIETANSFAGGDYSGYYGFAGDGQFDGLPDYSYGATADDNVLDTTFDGEFFWVANGANKKVLGDSQHTSTPHTTINNVEKAALLFENDAEVFFYSFVRGTVDGETAKFKMSIGGVDEPTITLPDNPSVHFIKWNENPYVDADPDTSAEEVDVYAWTPTGSTGEARINEFFFNDDSTAPGGEAAVEQGIIDLSRIRFRTYQAGDA